MLLMSMIKKYIFKVQIINMQRVLYYLNALLSVSFLRLLAYFPYPWVAKFGEMLGHLLFFLPTKRKRIVLINLQICFPDWSEAQRLQIAHQVFRYVIRSFAERSIFWFASVKRLQKWVKVDDQAHIAQLQKRPHIILNMHMMGMEAGAIRLSDYLVETRQAGGVSLYTPMRNPYFDAFIKKARERFGARMLPRANQAHVLRSLIREGTTLQFAPDMDFGLKNSAFVDFFGVPACTLTALSRLARVTGAQVIPMVTELLPNYQGYKLHILPAWENFPGESIENDTRRMNVFFESCIAPNPAQYYWVHRRFKTQPAGQKPIYKN